MRRRSVLTGFAAYALLGSGTVLPAVAAASGRRLNEALETVPGLTVVGEHTAPRGFRFLELDFVQPVDHADPASGLFRQRLTLLHRGFERPVVAHTSGYDVPEGPFRAEPTRLLDANQISIEHRFFGESRPNPVDWNELTIRQMAADEHRIIRVLGEVYRARWITTGASKGGMTAIYHRCLHPHDVAGTIAYVAPNNVDNERDHYDEFLANVGTAECRAALTALQRQALIRRDELVARLRARAASQGFTFDRVIGGIERGLEMSVVDTRFAFWQYRGLTDRDAIPATTASTDAIYEFIDATVGFSFYTDQGIRPYVPYYYQAGTQLGWPHVTPTELEDLLHHEQLLHPRGLVPREIPMRFRPHVMDRVDRWVRYAGQRLLFVYGENDPWSAEPFRLGPGTRDSAVRTVPGGNHGSEIAGLADEQRRQAIAAVRRWAGVGEEASLLDAQPFLPGLDDRPMPHRPL
ncbi:hypothetical protein FHX42_003348 [Saccharopolyspora lacisalsi]|uniref:Aminopeptidase n=1 Tax=Halosaccharopolyspora lacisalsi TaxID=1000566 RepID=A0A839DVI2_9PSEU|nr:S28 family serine protease [Halosaccharopolyspora lacisalsi]MBA8825982.1 hypothetical protein [Halosaccharopolyspora lacisalsi]